MIQVSSGPKEQGAYTSPSPSPSRPLSVLGYEGRTHDINSHNLGSPIEVLAGKKSFLSKEGRDHLHRLYDRQLISMFKTALESGSRPYHLPQSIGFAIDEWAKDEPEKRFSFILTVASDIPYIISTSDYDQANSNAKSEDIDLRKILTYAFPPHELLNALPQPNKQKVGEPDRERNCCT